MESTLRGAVRRGGDFAGVGLVAAALVARYGFDSPIVPAALVVAAQFAGALLYLLGRAAVTGPAEARDRWRAEAQVGVGLLLAAAAMQALRGGLSGPTAVCFYILALFVRERLAQRADWLSACRAQPRVLLRRVIGAWAAVLLAATVLLALPAATHPAVPDYGHNFWRHILTCAFMATSAATLNGATVYGVSDDLRPFGQAVLYATMQAGALLVLLLGWLALRPWVHRELSFRRVAAFWIALQVVGAAVTWHGWSAAGQTGPSPAWSSVFHAAAALNGAGFCLRADGLAAYVGVGAVFWPMLVLATIGIIGPTIVCDRLVALFRNIYARCRGVAPDAAGLPGFNLPSLELHTGLWAVCLGALAVFLCELPGLLPESLWSPRPLDLGASQVPLREMNRGTAWRAALLVSTAARTTGLHVIPILPGALGWHTGAVLLATMMLGGGIGALAGGIGIGALMIAIGRRWAFPQLPAGVAGVATRIVAAMMALNVTAVGLLAITESGANEQARAAGAVARRGAEPWAIVFDAVSLVNGVGLTTGLTANLTLAGRLGMIPLMAAGRMLPLLGWCWLAARMVPVARSVAIGSDAGGGGRR